MDVCLRENLQNQALFCRLNKQEIRTLPSSHVNDKQAYMGTKDNIIITRDVERTQVAIAAFTSAMPIRDS